MKNRPVVEMAAARALAKGLKSEQAGLLKLVLADDAMRADFLNQIDFEHGHRIARQEPDSIKLMAALDYALGRSTSVPHTVAEEIMDHWDSFTNPEKREIVETIKAAVSKNRAGQPVDARKWQEIVDFDEMAPELRP